MLKCRPWITTTYRKRCKECELIKPLSDYGPHPQTADRHLEVCKDCVSIRTLCDWRKRQYGPWTPGLPKDPWKARNRASVSRYNAAYYKRRKLFKHIFGG